MSGQSIVITSIDKFNNAIKRMSRELDMSVTHFERIREKLIPKHLGSNKQDIVKQAVRRELLMESPKDIIQKAKLKYLKPIGEIETIMKHFDAKFSNKKVADSGSAPKRKRYTPSVSSSYDQQLEQKMSYLLHLPSLKNIQKQAERYRYMLNSEEIKRKQAIKEQILSRFGEYMQAETKGHGKTGRYEQEKRKRVNTMH